MLKQIRQQLEIHFAVNWCFWYEPIFFWYRQWSDSGVDE